HRARVDRALESGDLRDLEALEREPYDFWILASKLTRAATMLRAGATSSAEALMTDAFAERHRHQSADTPAAPPGALAKDVVDIRNLVFRPKGDGVFAGSSWELRSLMPEHTPYFVVNPDVDVKLPTGAMTRITVRQAIPDHPNVLFLDGEQLAFFDRL